MKARFPALFATNFWGVLNDNFLKTLGAFIAKEWVPEEWQGVFISAAAAALVLPYIFFSPLAGRLTQIKSKKRILRIAKWAELIIMAIAIVGFWHESVWLVLGAITLMGLQSSLYSPAKYGLIRDIGGVRNLSVGMGGMEAISFAGMICGVILASYVADPPESLGAALASYVAVPPSALGAKIASYATDAPSKMIHYTILMLFAVLGLLCSYFIRAKEEYDTDYLPINPLRFVQSIHKKGKEYKGLNSIISALSWFWWLAATIQMGLIVYCEEVMGLPPFKTGVIMSCVGVGIVVGSIVAGYMDKRIGLLKYTGIFGWCIAIILLVVFLVEMPPLPFAMVLFVVAFFGGLFKTPLDVEMQRLVKGPLLNQFLSYFNIITFVYILFASVTFSIITLTLPIEYMFLMLSVAFFIVPFALQLNYRPIICYTVRSLLHWRYKIKVTGLEHMNTDRAHLILPNHSAVVDSLIIFGEMHEHKVQPLVDESYFVGIFKKILGLFDAISVPDLGKGRGDRVAQAQALNDATLGGLRKGGNVLFFPSGHITHDGVESIANRQLAHNTCTQLPENTDVLCVRVKGLWGSTWSRYGRNSTPNLATHLPKCMGKFLCGMYLFKKRREVSIHIENMTSQIKEWSTLDRRAFNQKLEEWYNS